MSGIRTVLIAGPTASGKSALAIAVAKKLGGAIVNADSMQVYRELQILSARPSEAEMDGVPHHLFGHVSATDPYSVARWLADARGAIAAIHQAGKVAVIAGGTGLYFKALTDGLIAAPTSTADIRGQSRARREAIGIQAFHDELVKLDPSAAGLNGNDTQRVLRAWEIATLKAGDRASNEHDQKPMPRLPLEPALKLVLDVERGTLYRRIDTRFDRMVADGGLGEAKAFWDTDPDPAAPAAKALGLPHLKEVLEGNSTIEAAIDAAKRDTRRYAKRQMTWFRNQMAGWQRLDTTEAAPGAFFEQIEALATQDYFLTSAGRRADDRV